MTVTIYHKPNCATSLAVLRMIRAAGETPQIINYLVDPPSRERLIELLGLLGMSVRQLLRRKNTPYDELGLDDPKWSDEELVDFMLAQPILIDRPIVVTKRGAVLARPPEKVFEILLARRLQKKDGKSGARERAGGGQGR